MRHRRLDEAVQVVDDVPVQAGRSGRFAGGLFEARAAQAEAEDDVVRRVRFPVLGPVLSDVQLQVPVLFVRELRVAQIAVRVHVAAEVGDVRGDRAAAGDGDEALGDVVTPGGLVLGHVLDHLLHGFPAHNVDVAHFLCAIFADAQIEQVDPVGPLGVGLGGLVDPEHHLWVDARATASVWCQAQVALAGNPPVRDDGHGVNVVDLEMVEVEVEGGHVSQ